MPELERRISGDWIELRGKTNDFHELLEALAVPPHELRAAADALKLSVEGGVVEFKHAVLGPVFGALEATRYKSLALEELGRHERSLTVLLLVILIERLMAVDSLPLARPREEKRVFGVDTLQVGTILTDVNARVKAMPDLRSHIAVKNILMQVQRYNGENQKMRELLPSIKPEMRTAFLANFTRTFEEIIASIRRHYTTLLQEEVAAAKARQEGFSLSLMPLKDLGPLMAAQAKEVARIRSTLAHTREEKYKTREALVRLYDGRQGMFKMLEEESRMFRLICQRTQQADLDACSQAMKSGFRDEIVGVLEKQGRREEPG